MLGVLADDDPILEATGDDLCMTAWTRQTFATASDATTAAQELLEDVLGLGFRARGGIVGAERPERRHDGPWRGELLDIRLTAVPDWA
jgi:hypothetical protein